MIRRLEDLAAFTAATVSDIPDELRDSLRDSMLVDEVDGSEVVGRLRERWPSLPSSFLDVLAQWSVLGKSFTGFIDLYVEDDVGDGADAFGLDASEFISIGSNGSGDPIGVAPEGTSLPVGSIVHFNHDTGAFAVLAPDFETFLIGLGNYGESWHEQDVEPEVAAGEKCQQRLIELGWWRTSAGSGPDPTTRVASIDAYLPVRLQ